ncbi:MAG: hypothetical protein B7Z06_11460 [Flavobacteriales bacterium 32-35-8]|nr:MAG: hypothetical protein B7Z06_11460 [Flavobacteriales bacterium 32-35-8]
MSIAEILLITVIFSFILFLTYEQVKLLYRRHLKSYTSEIENYLESQELTLLEILHYPRKEDWGTSPFPKPPKFRFSFLVIEINGTLANWNDQKYIIIRTNEGKSIWLEVDTTYFKKPKLTFKAGKEDKKIKSHTEFQDITINHVTENCPACTFKLDKSDNECPDCGLIFK